VENLRNQFVVGGAGNAWAGFRTQCGHRFYRARNIRLYGKHKLMLLNGSAGGLSVATMQFDLARERHGGAGDGGCSGYVTEGHNDTTQRISATPVARMLPKVFVGQRRREDCLRAERREGRRLSSGRQFEHHLTGDRIGDAKPLAEVFKRVAEERGLPLSLPSTRGRA
jgi:hypothetical protein